MNLPSPFESARDIRPDALGRIALVDGDGVTLAHLPLEAAYEITPERNSFGPSEGYGYGYGYGYCFGHGSGDGYGYGYGYGHSSGEGRGKSP